MPDRRSVRVRHVDDDHVEAGVDEGSHLLDHRVRVTEDRAFGEVGAERLSQQALDGLRLLRGLDEHQRAQPGRGDLLVGAVDVLAVPAQDLELVTDRVGAAEQVAHVGVLGDEPERLLLAAAADEDRWPARPHRSRHVLRSFDPVVATRERRRILGEHRPADAKRLVETLEPLAHGWEVEAEALVLLLVPGRADAADGATRRR